MEGMAIGGYAMGANRGFIYIRAEYPLAIKRLQIAIEQAYKNGLLGKNLLRRDSISTSSFASAPARSCAVRKPRSCVPSKAAVASRCRVRPSRPSAVFGAKPTNINNVETWAAIPAIIRRGAVWYATFGTEKTKGTKVFALRRQDQEHRAG